MIVEIKIKNKIVELLLRQDKKILGSLSFPEDNNLSEKLLPSIDKLLKRNKLQMKDVRKIITDVDTPESFTTARIAEAVAKTWNFTFDK